MTRIFSYAIHRSYKLFRQLNMLCGFFYKRNSFKVRCRTQIRFQYKIVQIIILSYYNNRYVEFFFFLDKKKILYTILVKKTRSNVSSFQTIVIVSAANVVFFYWKFFNNNYLQKKKIPNSPSLRLSMFFFVVCPHTRAHTWSARSCASDGPPHFLYYSLSYTSVVCSYFPFPSCTPAKRRSAYVFL